MDWRERSNIRILVRVGAIGVAVIGFILYNVLSGPIAALFNPCRNFLSEEEVARVLKKPVGRLTLDSDEEWCSLDFEGPGAGSVRPRWLDVSVARSDYDETVKAIRESDAVLSVEREEGFPVETSFIRHRDGRRALVLKAPDRGHLSVELYAEDVPRDALEDVARLAAANLPSMKDFLRGE